MTIYEKAKYFRGLTGIKERLLSEFPLPAAVNQRGGAFDPEMLYVECHNCGIPILWEKGKTTELLHAAGVDIRTLDERCMIVSEGCPTCRPKEKNGFTLAVVRIAGLTPEEAVHMMKPAGTA